jgi:hypothetical protein
MIWSRARPSADVRLLLDSERQIVVLPAAARARALSRARAALAAGAATRPAPSRALSGARWAAAGLTCFAMTAVGATAYEVGLRARRTALAVGPSPPADPPAPHWAAGDEPLLDLPAAPAREAKPTKSRTGAGRLERQLIERARAAVAREDFADAIHLLTEHRRRFRAGRLVEEREALRVKALAGLGRRDDARHAAAEFEVRFPDSPLLPTIRQMPDSAR